MCELRVNAELSILYKGRHVDRVTATAMALEIGSAWATGQCAELNGAPKEG